MYWSTVNIDHTFECDFLSQNLYFIAYSNEGQSWHVVSNDEYLFPGHFCLTTLDQLLFLSTGSHLQYKT